MLRIDREQKTLVPLKHRELKEVNLSERGDLQRMIVRSPDEFFREMGEQLLLLGEEIRPDSFVEDRIDLLALDPQGACVVIELKRAHHKLQLLQALSYAAMVSKWEAERCVDERAKLAGSSPEDAEEEIEQFLDEDMAHVNERQRVILVAGAFEYEVLITAEWLTQTYGVDVRAYRLLLSNDGKREYLTCACVFPPPELTEHARKRGRGKTKPARYPDWDASLKVVENPAIVEFFRRELASGRENYLRRRMLRYRFNGKRILHLSGRRQAAYVWQAARFEGDEDYWRTKIGDHAKVQPVRDGRALRFYLATKEDFARFAEAVDDDLPKVEFVAEIGEDYPEEN